jgi:hypothetical protein
MTAPVTMVRHGYTLANLERLARAAVARDFWNQGIHPADRFDLSFSAMAEYLYASDEPPAPADLLNAASAAVRQQAQGDRSAHGISSTDVYKDARNFYRYWWQQFRCTPSPEDLVVDRTALWQIFPVLAPRYRNTLLALAAHGDHAKAAAALGYTRRTYECNLSEARRAFYLLWHEGEKPSRLWAMDKRHGTGADDHTVMHSIVRRRKRQRAREARGE